MTDVPTTAGRPKRDIMELKHFYPHEQLKPLIKKYWLLEVAEKNDLTAIHSFFPLDAVEIIFHLKNSLVYLCIRGLWPDFLF